MASSDDEADEEDGARLPAELWLAVASSFSLADFAVVCALARTCHTLRPLSRAPQLWCRNCGAAFSLTGQLSLDSQLRFYSWSWHNMFLHRPRLRFDGLYYVATTKLLRGLNEGRGMKYGQDSGQDWYRPEGRLVTSYRVLRFFPEGSMFSYLCSSHAPADVRKAAAAVTPDWPASLQQKLKGACWGAFDACEVEPQADAPGRLGLTARVLLYNEAYPNMAPATVRYVLDLRAPQHQPRSGSSTGGMGGYGKRTTLASNSVLSLTAMAIESTAGELESLPTPENACVFLPFEGPLPPRPPESPLAHLMASGQRSQS